MKNFLYQIHEKLNENIFENDKMKDEIREKLLKIADFAIEKAKINKKHVSDIILTGSLAGYNYNEFSDIDLHIIYDLSFVKDEEKKELAKKYFDEKRRILNLKYNFSIKKHKVEIYFQEATEPHKSLGIYSILKNKWIKYPEKVKLDLDNYEIIKKTKEIIKDIKETIERDPSDYNSLEVIFDKIVNMRKESLKKENNVFSVENLVFKFLRKTGIIESLTNYLTYLKSKELTIERKLDAWNFINIIKIGKNR